MLLARINKNLIALLVQQAIVFSNPGVNLLLRDPILNGFGNIIPIYFP